MLLAAAPGHDHVDACLSGMQSKQNLTDDREIHIDIEMLPKIIQQYLQWKLWCSLMALAAKYYT